MNPELAALLAQLRDIEQPPQPAWWPPAPGWWLLALLLLGLLVGLILWYRRSYLQGAYRRQALAELKMAYKNWQTSGDSSAFLQQCGQLLRRLGIYLAGREQTASLSGQSWREFLQQHFGEHLSEPSLNALIEQPYRRDPQLDADRLYQELERELRQTSGRKNRHV